MSLNNDKAVFAIPYKHVTLFISYLKGPNVEEWANARQKDMDTDVNHGTLPKSEYHWTKFKKAFNDAYANLGKQVAAERDL